MKTEALKTLIQLCRDGNCSIKLEACQTGIVATVDSSRSHVNLNTSVYLDFNDKEIGEKLSIAIKRVQ